jgi:hypothetical protein
MTNQNITLLNSVRFQLFTLLKFTFAIFMSLFVHPTSLPSYPSLSLSIYPTLPTFVPPALKRLTSFSFSPLTSASSFSFLPSLPLLPNPSSPPFHSSFPLLPAPFSPHLPSPLSSLLPSPHSILLHLTPFSHTSLPLPPLTCVYAGLPPHSKPLPNWPQCWLMRLYCPYIYLSYVR